MILLSLVAASVLAVQQDSIPARHDTIRSYRADEVVVTGQLLPTSISRSVHRVRIVDAERIRAQQAVTLRDVLLQESGIRLQQDMALGTSLSLGGISGNNVKILVDGVPVIGRLDGSIDLSQIPVQRAQRIEIVEGPMSIMYGTDALGGVINIITAAHAVDSLRVSAYGQHETVGVWNAGTTVRGMVSNVDVHGSFTRNLFRGWNPPGTIAERSFQWKPREQYLVDAGFGLSVSSMQLKYDGSWWNDLILTRGEPRSPFGTSAIDEHTTTRRMQHSVSLLGDIVEGWKLSGLTSFSSFDRMRTGIVKDLVTGVERTSMQPGSSDTNTQRTVMTRWMLRPPAFSDAFALEVGGEGTSDVVTGNRIAQGRATMVDVGLFTTLQWQPIRQLIVQPGLRHVYNSRYGGPFTPALNVRWSASPEVTFRMEYGRGFRAPSLRELAMEFIDINHNITGNDDLRAEYSHHAGMSMDINLAGERALLSIKPSIVFNDISDQITLAQVDATRYQYVNIGRQRTMMARTDVVFDVSDLQIKLSGALTGTQRRFETGTMSSWMMSPEGNLQCTWSDPWVGLRWNGFAKVTGSQPTVRLQEDGTLTNGSIAAYTVIDVTADLPVILSFFRASIGVRNLLDVTMLQSTSAGGTAHSPSTGSIPMMWGRSMLFTIRYEM